MRVPISVAASLAASGLAFAAHLALAPEPFAASSGLVVAVGIVIFTVIAVIGLLINRGKWSRVLSIVLVAGILGLGAVTEPTVWALLGVGTALGALFGLTGRWLSGWIRPRPSATGPGPRVVMLVLGLLALVPAVGVAAPAGLAAGHGVLGAGGVLLAWSYSKAQPWALWALRLGLPIAAVPAVLAGPPGGSVLLGLMAAALTALAWTEDARLAVTPIFDRPPGPRRGTAKTGDGAPT